MKKQEKIIKMFDEIAPSYDITNRILSFGIDRKWRKRACDLIFEKYNKNNNLNILDVACGTGDMMDIWVRAAQKKSINIKNIIGIDPSKKMLELAKKKFPNFMFKKALADNTGIKNEYADILSISYGIRNIINLNESLKEFNKIIKTNGYIVILEFTKNNKKGIVDNLKNFYLNKILPCIGGLISKNKKAYKYLPDSIEKFIDSETLINKLEEYGFKVEFCKAFSFNVSTLFIAKKIVNC